MERLARSGRFFILRASGSWRQGRWALIGLVWIAFQGGQVDPLRAIAAAGADVEAKVAGLYPCVENLGPGPCREGSFPALGQDRWPLGPDSSWRRALAAERARYAEALRRQPGLEELELHFFPPDSSWRVEAAWEPATGAEPFWMPALTGEPERYVRVGRVHFRRGGRPYRLEVYRNLDRLRLPGGRDKLLLPFRDASNGETTYAAGRYLELRAADLPAEPGARPAPTLELDFNRAHFPVCAYGLPASCPLPPATNSLPWAIRAGERLQP